MPELPEVETVRRVLKNDLIGLKISDIEIRYNGIIEDDITYFLNNVKGKTIEDILRRGKYLIFKLNEGYLLSHLRMEGKYFYLPNNSLDNKHIHVIFKFDNGYSLLYQDVRKFGKMSYKKDDELYNTHPLKDLGVDPVLDTDINEKLIHSKIIKKHIPIKTILLEQSIITGLGNIYVDEVLFSSKIDPNRLGNTITLEESNNIIRYSKEILNKAILNKGTTIRSYTSSLGVEGNYQNFLNVHTKNICPHCKNALTRVKINGRTTYFCNNCQR